MATKIITDLPLRGSVSDECNIPVDDTLQTYRITAAQLATYILANNSISTAMLQASSVTTAKLAAQLIHGFTGVVPSGADYLAGADASDSNNNKKFLMLNVKNPLYRSITSTDTLVDDDESALLSGASFDLTIPAISSGNANKVYTITHDGTSLTQVYTLLCPGYTIGGVASGSFKLYTKGEMIRIQSPGTGTDWKIIGRNTNCSLGDLGALAISSSSHYSFTISSASIVQGTVFTCNGNTFYVGATTSSSTTLNCYGTGSPGSSGTLTYLRGPTTGNRAFSAVSTAGAPAKGSSTHETTYLHRIGNRVYGTWDAKWAAGTAGTGDYGIFFPSTVRPNVTGAHYNLGVGSSTVTGGILQTNVGYGFHSSSIGSSSYAVLGDQDFFKLILVGAGFFNSGVAGQLANAQSHSVNFSYAVDGWQP